MHVYWATGFIKLWNYEGTNFIDAAIIMFQNRLFEIMFFLLVITDFWSVQPKTLLNRHSMNSKQFSVFCYFFLLNCHVINSGWSLWIVSSQSKILLGLGFLYFLLYLSISLFIYLQIYIIYLQITGILLC